MKTWILALALLAACSSPYVEREPGDGAASPEGVAERDDLATSLAALRQALGGEKRLAALADVRASYACRGPGTRYRIEMELPAARPWRMRWLFPGQPASEFELDGQAGWSVAADGQRTELDPATADMARSHAFPRLVQAPEEFLGPLEHAGAAQEEGRLLETLGAVHRPASLFLDTATNLPVRLELGDANDPSTRVVRVRFETWREVEGLLVPERVVAVDAKGEWVMELAEVRFEFDAEAEQAR
jgi:hypothetical protein